MRWRSAHAGGPRDPTFRGAEDWGDAARFADVTAAVRLGLDYALLVDHYDDPTDAANHRGHRSAFYRF